MTELVSPNTMILDHLDFKPSCEKWAKNPERRCVNPAVVLATFHWGDIVYSRLVCGVCLGELEGEGRVYGVKKL